MDGWFALMDGWFVSALMFFGAGRGVKQRAFDIEEVLAILLDEDRSRLLTAMDCRSTTLSTFVSRARLMADFFVVDLV